MGEQPLGEFLVSQGLLRKDGLRRALEAQTALECRLGSVLLDLGLMPENLLLKALGRYSSARTASARHLAFIPPEVIEMVPGRFALRHQVVPFAFSGKTLSVATIDPKDLLIEDELGQLTGCMIASFVAHEVRLHQAMAKYYGMQLSVQASSLLKRLPAADEADSELEAAGVGKTGGDSTDALTDVIKSDPQKPKREFRAGLATRRDPDSTMMVELSEDELADFPSLRGSLDDTGAGKTEVSIAEPAQPPPDAIKVVERPAAQVPPPPESPHAEPASVVSPAARPTPTGDETVVGPPPAPDTAREVDDRLIRRQPPAAASSGSDQTVVAPPAAAPATPSAEPPAAAEAAPPPAVTDVEPTPPAGDADDLGTMMIAALPAARAGELQPAAEPPSSAGDETRPAAEPPSSAGDETRPAAEPPSSAGDETRPAAEPPSSAGDETRPAADPRPEDPAKPAAAPGATKDGADETHPHARPDEDSKASTGPLDPIESRLAAAAGVLQAADMREDIADAVMSFCEPFLQRRLLLAVRDNTVIGWRGEGVQVDTMWVKSMAIPLSEPSVFVSLAMGKEYWRGSLPPTPANQELLLGLGGEQPSECVILPLIVRSKPIGFLYGDNVRDGLGDVPWIPLRRLVAKAGLAFEISILRNKVRTL